jgi:hypothetical protein
MGYSSTISVIVENKKGEICHLEKVTRGIFKVGIMIDNIGELVKVQVTGKCENDEVDDKISCGLYCFGNDDDSEIYTIYGTKRGVSFEPKLNFQCNKALVFVFTGSSELQKIEKGKFHYLPEESYRDLCDVLIRAEYISGYCYEGYEADNDNYCTVVSYENFFHGYDNTIDVIPFDDLDTLIPNSLLENKMYEYDIINVLDRYRNDETCSEFLLKLINTKHVDLSKCKDIAIRLFKEIDCDECLIALLKRDDYDINYVDEHLKTVLDYAMEMRYEDLTRMLIKKGAKCY